MTLYIKHVFQNERTYLWKIFSGEIKIINCSLKRSLFTEYVYVHLAESTKNKQIYNDYQVLDRTSKICLPFRCIEKFSDLEEEDNFAVDLVMSQTIVSRTEHAMEPTTPDFKKVKVKDVFSRLVRFLV